MSTLSAREEALAGSVFSVALMNDYEVVVRGLAHMLQPYTDRVRVAELDVNLPPAQPVDITLYDTFAVTQADGDRVADLVRNDHPGRVVVYSWDTNPDLVAAGLTAGVAGYLPKTLNALELVDALARVHAGEVVVIAADPDKDPDLGSGGSGDVAAREWPGREFGLTPRESEVLALIAQGLSNKEIAARTYLSMNTVKTYIRSAYRRIGVETRAQAVRWGLMNGMDSGQVQLRRIL